MGTSTTDAAQGISGKAVISVVMPALNEESTVGRQVRSILNHPSFRRLPLARVIVVDNGSLDATAAVAQAAGALVVSQPLRGYGSACLAGVLAAADADIVLLMDADESDDLEGAARVAELALEGAAELVMGSRTHGRIEQGALTPLQRAGNTVAGLLVLLLFGKRVSDIGPLRAIRRADLLALHMGEMTYGWSIEMLVKSLRAGYQILEVPVGCHRRAGGRSKVSGTVSGSMRAGWCMLTTVLRYAGWKPLTGELVARPVLLSSE